MVTFQNRRGTSTSLFDIFFICFWKNTAEMSDKSTRICNIRPTRRIWHSRILVRKTQHTGTRLCWFEWTHRFSSISRSLVKQTKLLNSRLHKVWVDMLQTKLSTYLPTQICKDYTNKFRISRTRSDTTGNIFHSGKPISASRGPQGHWFPAQEKVLTVKTPIMTSSGIKT